MSLAKISPNFPKYSCETCGIFTNNKKDYTNHLMTAKHSKFTSFNTLSQNLPQNGTIFPQNSVDQSINNCVESYEKCTHTCDNCSKIYKSRVGLWYHNKKCKVKNVENITEYDFNGNLSKIEAEIESKIKNNMLDNETCKDAININEFVDNIQMKLSDLENFGHLGYVEGVSRILIKNLKDLDIVKRPIHCSDLKREVLYVKNEDKWTKEDETTPIFKSAIKQVANKNIKQIPVWRDEHPSCLDPQSKQNDVYLKIVSNSMSGGSQEEMNKNYDKIVKNIAKEVTIEKK